jgi:iron-sulfur cluster assembly accessory protein
LKLRVRVEGGGCSGLKYEFSLDGGGVGADDIVFGAEGAWAVVDGVSLGFLRGATLDWDDSLMKSSFVVASNPNAESACGCKSSFAMKGTT